MQRLFVSPFLLFLVVNTPLALVAERTHEITIDDYFTQSWVTACEISPDGRYVAYVEMRWQGEDEGRNTDLWVVATATKKVRRLTFDPASDSSPAWSKSDGQIYFLSGREVPNHNEPPLNGDTQVWRVDPNGSEPVAVTRVAKGVAQFQLSPDGHSLYYVKHIEHQEEEWKELREKFAGLNYGHGKHEVSELWKLDLQSWREKKLIGESRYIRDFEVSPDETNIAMITTPDELLISNEGQSRVDIFDVSKGQSRPLPDEVYRAQAPSPYGWLEELRWSPDGKYLAFTIGFDGYPPEILVATRNDETWAVRKMPRHGDVTVDLGLAWRGPTELCYLGDEHARKRLYNIAGVDQEDPETRILTGGDVAVEYVSLSEGGDKAALVKASTEHPEDLFLLELPTAHETRLTNVNPQVDDWKLPSIQLVQWTGEGGQEVEGILELPPDYKPGEKLPLVVEIHGGPTACTKVAFQYWIYGRTLFPAQGYALLSPNYRGSTGYGDKFMTDLVGRENDVEVQDILAGVDAMIAKGIADPERIGVMGWSNGGYLTNCLITKGDRFKAASSGAGVLDMSIQWATEDTPGHVINYMKGLPWQAREEYQRASPLYELNRVRAATLIHVGEGDERVPAAHSRALHRGLLYYVNKPVQLVMYPGAGHGLTIYKHRQAKMEWDLAWFDKYLKGAPEATKEKNDG